MWFAAKSTDKKSIERPATAICDGSGLMLSRPDQHVAWRGDRPSSDPLALIDHVRGVANQGKRAAAKQS